MSKQIIFKNVDNFKVWKHEVEQKTNTYYLKTSGSSKNVNVEHTYTYYKCHRNGYYNSNITGQRHIKTQGSNKINGFYPASMNIIMSETKQCTVTFIETHMGHQTDLGNLPLDINTRNDIASKISDHIPFEHILNQIRDNISNNVLERTHLLTKKELYNIEASYNLNNEAVKHRNDALSVETWVQNLRNDNKFAIIYYKPHDEIDMQFSSLKKKDFLLIIMNNFQLSMLQKFGHDVICVDETHME